ncbi:similar to Saccharomyces cerevisiae YOL119C MCH4 Protein with similarity to mammalian monocarboxylate permeases [Maudiozyma saulgeensis]|uniref:Similar to Saccharomyces cerevisiae YOL119C MCH4 Protein with similarity to mammalian monocarboxylate permeases n=1 Tax=Maudiozyma saulgeensis TaxID=1789683 RepID=A0A1X7RAH0_9SACH|nr:similar to Saccharomyces cerevisiae YOL119C MCH4 Protein with similarity to mammalian monocarboxylate permeases [Kazachstania saulgeensis]
MLPWNFLSKPAKVFTPKDHNQRVDERTIEHDAAKQENSHTSDIELHSLQYTVDESPFQVTGFSFQDTSPDEPTGAIKKSDIGKVRASQENTEAFETSDISDEDENDGKYVDENGRVYPDGGRDAWLVVFGSFMGLIPVFGIVNSLGAIESYVSKNQLANVSQSTISWIFSLFLVISSLSCVLTGGYFDRNGASRPIIVGILFYTGGLIALADCQEVYQFILAFSVLAGIGTGVLMTPLVSVITTWFYRKRGIASSIATMGGSIGGILIAPVLRKLYVEVGFKWAIRIFALVCFVCLVVSFFLVKEFDKEELVPFATKMDEIKWYFSSSFNWRYFLEGRFLFAALGAALVESALTALATYIASYSLAAGNSESTSYNLIMVTNAAGMFGRYIPGYVADKYLGGFNVTIITISMAVLVNFIIWLPFGTHIGALWTYVIIYGFSTGSIFSLTPVCIGQISRTEDFGKRFSTVYFFEAIITIPVLPIGGAIIGNGSISNYNKFIVFNSVIMGVGVACYAVSRYISVGIKMVKY